MDHQGQGAEVCELCESSGKLNNYSVSGLPQHVNSDIKICQNCFNQLNGSKDWDTNHWRCLSSSMWSTSPAIQVQVWRLLNAHRNEGWPQDLLDMLYLDEEVLGWAQAVSSGGQEQSESSVIHKDSNGTTLQSGDSVLLIKDLDVKGGGFKAKRGTLVRNIILVENNEDHIEGKVNGQEIVILTKFVRKA